MDAGGLLASALGLIEANRLPDCVMRLTVTRGVGLRGYSPKGAEHPTVAITLHPAAAPGALPPAWRLATSSIRLPSNSAIARLKTCNKLPQILARAEADAAGADEPLLLNTDGYVVEGPSSNLFWLERDVLCTPPIDASGILPGVTRQTLCELAQALPAPLKVEEKLARPEALLQADAVDRTS